MFRWSDNWN